MNWPDDWERRRARLNHHSLKNSLVLHLSVLSKRLCAVRQLDAELVDETNRLIRKGRVLVDDCTRLLDDFTNGAVQLGSTIGAVDHLLTAADFELARDAALAAWQPCAVSRTEPLRAHLDDVKQLLNYCAGSLSAEDIFGLRDAIAELKTSLEVLSDGLSLLPSSVGQRLLLLASCARAY